MIVEKILEAKERTIKLWPVNSNRASELGHPCLRYHVFNRTRWQEKSLHDVRLQLIFDMGKEIEKIVVRDLLDANLTVIEQQRSFSWPEYQITGMIDLKVLQDGYAMPVEVKSCSPFVFQKVSTIDDLKGSKYLHMRKYPAQLNIYMLMDNKPRSLFLFKDKASGAMKEIPMEIDYELGEVCLQRAEATNRHIANKTNPDYQSDILSEGWCDDCAYLHICLPDHIGKEIEIDAGELAAMVARMEEIKPLCSEYDDLDGQIKKMVEGKEKILAGDYFITGKYIERKDGGRYWKRKVIKVAA